MAFVPAPYGQFGFETGSSAHVPAANKSGDTPSTTYAHTGVYSLRLTDYFKIPFLPGGVQINFSIWVYKTGNNNEQIKFGLTTDDASTLQFRITSGDLLKVYRDSTVLTTGSVVVPTNAWFNVNGTILLHGTTGSIITTIDGNPDISFIGNTHPGGTAISTFDLLAGTATPYFDDVVIGLSGTCPDLRAEGHPVNEDTPDQDWSISTGGALAWEVLDEVPPDDDTYIYTTANAQKVLCGTTDFNTLGKTLYNVVHWTRARKETADTVQIKQVAKNSEDELATAALDLLTSYSYFAQTLQNAPDGGAWNVTKLNDLKIGVESVI